jgi:aspartyl-tRNA(Asn)/glutamyl-tRNA(Gln) amidotransferase subunit A
MSDTELAFMSIAELAPVIAKGEVSPVAVTEAVLDRIGRQDARLKAYITVTAEAARHAARAADAAIRAGNHLGPLHGIPIGVKDLFATRGVRTTFGSPLFADWIPDFDAAVVERLKRAGAVILGKTNLHELAFGTTSANPHYGAVRNPWNLECHPGGSSGGSAAAVAAGLATAALGSDTGASIRQPAACCGIVGLKPTFGRVSKFGGLPLSWSMDHAGPVTRTVADAALMLQVLAGYDSRDPGSARRAVPDFSASLGGGVRGLRLGVPRDFFFEELHPAVATRVEEALAVFTDLGAAVEEIRLPDMRAARAAGTVILFSEAAAYHAESFRRRPEAFSPELRALIEMGNFYTAVQLVQAHRLRRHLQRETARAMAGFAALVIPTSPLPATPIDGRQVPGEAALRPRNTLPFDLISLPAISVPCGFTADGLPVGLQIVGKAFDEAGVLRIASTYEQATEWHRRRPPV